MQSFHEFLGINGTITKISRNLSLNLIDGKSNEKFFQPMFKARFSVNFHHHFHGHHFCQDKARNGYEKNCADMQCVL